MCASRLSHSLIKAFIWYLKLWCDASSMYIIFFISFHSINVLIFMKLTYYNFAFYDKQKQVFDMIHSFCKLHLLFVFSKYRAININQIIWIMLVHTVNTCQNERSRAPELDSFQIASIVFYMNTLDNSSIKNRKQLRKAQQRRMAWN